MKSLPAPYWPNKRGLYIYKGGLLSIEIIYFKVGSYFIFQWKVDALHPENVGSVFIQDEPLNEAYIYIERYDEKLEDLL